MGHLIEPKFGMNIKDIHRMISFDFSECKTYSSFYRDRKKSNALQLME